MSRLLILLSAIILMNGSAHSYRRWPLNDYIDRLKKGLSCTIVEKAPTDVPISLTNNGSWSSPGPHCEFGWNDNTSTDEELISGNQQEPSPKRSRSYPRQYTQPQRLSHNQQTSPLIFILRPVLD